MPSVTFVKPITNIDESSEEYGYLKEINDKFGFEVLFIEKKEQTPGFIRKTVTESYSIYWEVGMNEYQLLFAFDRIDRQAIICYLIGVLTGMERASIGA